jgi:RNA 2',3'-cyclic 3'-phosphodiesterase
MAEAISRSVKSLQSREHERAQLFLFSALNFQVFAQIYRRNLLRTFIAIPLPKECQSMLDHMQQDLRKYSADVRWVSISSIHLTLKFLGEVEPALIQNLSESLEKVSVSEQNFSIRLYGLGCFPNQRSPRVIWCGVDGDTEGLSRLQRKVEDICQEFGFAPENRPFHPHLTLGRVTGKRNLQPLLDCIKIGSEQQCSFDVDSYNVYKSTLKPQGAVYSVLKTITLGGGARRP